MTARNIKALILIAAFAFVPRLLASENAHAAKISMKQARAIALKKVPGGKIKSAELEREHGKLIYSFDISTGKPGMTEVNVDAMTGKIVATEQESPAKEAAEKKADTKEHKH